MDAASVIAAIRDGRPDPEGVAWFAAGLASGAVSDAQAGAFAMAVCLRGLGPAGRVALTRAMRDSGAVLRWDLPGPVLDKHSTGGIGDCVSLPLAAALAACGAFVPMISGRGLGHTGGTLDKLEAIPGLAVELDEDTFRAATRSVGCAIVAASGRLAPADRRLYAIRDVSGTVESIDLITASILSKKLAAGLGALVLDVKTGSGAFMAAEEDARALARALVETAAGAGCPAVALVTCMDQPPIPAVGNALEVAAVMRFLAGEPFPRLRALTGALGGEALVLGGLAADAEAGAARIGEVLDNGQAAERFAAMLAAQGTAPAFMERWDTMLPRAPVILPVPAPRAGHVRTIDGRALGRVVVALGGGRRREGDRIDPSVGLDAVLPLGSKVAAGDPLALIHAADDAMAETAARAVAMAFGIGGPAPAPPLIRGRIA